VDLPNDKVWGIEAPSKAFSYPTEMGSMRLLILSKAVFRFLTCYGDNRHYLFGS